jgi:hypothetical protein
MSESNGDGIAKPAIPAEPLAPLAPLASLAELAGASPPPPPPVRDPQGRFITGNSGGGRPKGARNRLTEVFMSAIADDFAQHGMDALARVRNSDPVAYLKIVAAMVPPELALKRELEPTIDYAELTYEEAGELADAALKRRIIKRAIEGDGVQ